MRWGRSEPSPNGRGGRVMLGKEFFSLLVDVAEEAAEAIVMMMMKIAKKREQAQV